MSDLKQRILDASVALVEEQGVRAMSFREVARRAGVSHQAPYHHFGNHQGILRAIAREGFGALAEDMASAGRAEADPLAALHAAGIAYVAFARSHVGHIRVMFDHALVAAAPAELEEAERTYAVLVRLAHEAHAEGHGTSMPPDTLAHLCWCTVHGLATLLIEGALGAKAGPLDDREASALAEGVVGALSALLRRRPPGA